MRRTRVKILLALTGIALIPIAIINRPKAKKDLIKIPSSSILKTRGNLLNSLKSRKFDLLIIGGGATGAGCALDAATRGLDVALVDQNDFASGTSSRSTKLVHGGVRYLEKAFLNLDVEQYKLVVEALHERSTFLNIAPYLSYQLPIMLPIYNILKVPYVFIY